MDSKIVLNNNISTCFHTFYLICPIPFLFLKSQTFVSKIRYCAGPYHYKNYKNFVNLMFIILGIGMVVLLTVVYVFIILRK